MLKILSMILVCLFASAMLAVPASASSEKVNIEMWHAMKAEKNDALESLVNRFMKENPDISVTTKLIKSPDPKMYGNDYACLYRNIIQGLAGGTPPDIAQVYENWTTQFVMIGAVTPFSHFKGADAITQAEINDIFPSFRNACSFNGDMYAMPFNKSIYVMYYNKALFSKLGINPPKTWEEAKAVSKKIYESEGIPGLEFTPSVDIFGNILYTSGGEFIRNDVAVFNDAKGIAAMNYLREMTENNYAAYSYSSYKDFVSGKAGFIIETTSRIGALKNDCKFNYGITFVPGEKKAYHYAGTNLAIFSQDEAKKLASWKLIRFLNRKENNIELAERTGYLPTTLSASESPEYKKFISSNPGYETGIQALKYGVPQPNTAAWESIRGFITDAVMNSLAEGQDAEEAVNAAAEYSNDLLKGFK